MGKKLEWTLEYHGTDPKCTLDGIDYHAGDTFKTPSMERARFLSVKKGWVIIDEPVFDEEKPPEVAQEWSLTLTADRPKYTFEKVDYHQGDTITVYRWTDVCILRKGGWTLNPPKPAAEVTVTETKASESESVQTETESSGELDETETEPETPGITETHTWLDEQKGPGRMKRKYTRHA